ncbi:hypothetical protein TRFO_18489 [Tritrichomonas foetus]|uniref:Uncharacterized protein n=1 Tax=Tritrichomonas foetus TaxID=1144522 RepID=A0A1J4KKS3_9EUKA|nr:hypothetical protein TRFO_18489 [Tritrichomonas foetus]|eukprot:OHT11905.1 hypothetical protein TRFO_18489 [Tritrichomonas foetus]
MNEKKEKIDAEFLEIQKEILIYKDPQKHLPIIKKTIAANDKEFKKKKAEFEDELLKLNQEISMTDLNAVSMFAALETELANARNSELNHEKNQTTQELKRFKISQDRLLAKFKKDEENSIKMLEKVLKNNPADPVESLTTDHITSTIRRKDIFDALIQDLKDICANRKKVLSMTYRNQMKEIRSKSNYQAQVLRSYLARMKTQLAERDIEISAIESRAITQEDLIYDIMETIIDMHGGDPEENARMRREMRRNLEKDNKFLSKGNYLIKKMKNFLDERMEVAKEQIPVDGIDDNRPFSQKSHHIKNSINQDSTEIKNCDEVECVKIAKNESCDDLDDYYHREKYEYISKINKRRLHFYRYNYETQVFLKKTGKVRLPILRRKKKKLTEADLLPDEFDNLYSDDDSPEAQAKFKAANDFINKQRLKKLGLIDGDSSEEFEEKILLLGGRKRAKSAKLINSNKLPKLGKKKYFSDEPLDRTLQSLMPKKSRRILNESNKNNSENKSIPNHDYKNDTLAIVDGKIGFIKDGKFVEVDPSEHEGKSGYFKDGKFIEIDPGKGFPEGIEDGTFVILNGKTGIIKDGKFVEVDPNRPLPDGTVAVVDGVEGVYINGKFVPKKPDKDGVYIDGKFIPLDELKDKENIPEGTFAVINGKNCVFKDGKFIPIDESQLDIPEDAVFAIVDGKPGYIKDGKFVQLDQDQLIQAIFDNVEENKDKEKNEQKNGFYINGEFVEFDPEKGIPEGIPDGTIGVVDGKTGVFINGKFVPSQNGYFKDGKFIEFDPEKDGIPSDIPDGTEAIINGQAGVFKNGVFIPNSVKNDNEQKTVNGYFTDGKFIELKDGEIPADLPDGTAVIINGQTGIIKDGKFIPMDPNECGINQSGYFKDGKFIPFDPQNGIPDDIPDGTIAIINGQAGVFKDGKFIPNNQENNDHRSGYYKDGKFIEFDPEKDGIPIDIPDGTIGMINGKKGIFKNGKFIPIEQEKRNRSGYYIDGKFIPFDPEKDGIPENIPDGTIGEINGQQGIFKDGRFIPFTQEELEQMKQPGYFKDGKFIPIDPNNMNDIPDGSFGVMNGQKGFFKNGKFIPINEHNGPRAGYFKDGKFIPIDDPNDPNIPPDAQIVYMLPDGTIVSQEDIRKLYPGLNDAQIYQRIRRHFDTSPRNHRNNENNWPPSDGYEYRPPDPLYRIEPLKICFPKHSRSEMRKKKHPPRVELTPEQIRELMYNSPNIQFDPNTAALANQCQAKNMFGICNFRKNDDEAKSPRRYRPTTGMKKGNQQVNRSEPSNNGPLYFVRSFENNPVLPPLKTPDLPTMLNNQESNPNTLSPQRRQHLKSQSAYQKVTATFMKNGSDYAVPPLDDFQREILEETPKQSSRIFGFSPTNNRRNHSSTRKTVVPPLNSQNVHSKEEIYLAIDGSSPKSPSRNYRNNLFGDEDELFDEDLINTTATGKIHSRQRIHGNKQELKLLKPTSPRENSLSKFSRMQKPPK